MNLFTPILTFFGNLFNLGEDLSPALNQWIENCVIPAAQRAGVQRRLRRCKWKLKHYPKLQAHDLVFEMFPEQSAAMQSDLTNVLNEEMKSVRTAARMTRSDGC